MRRIVVVLFTVFMAAGTAPHGTAYGQACGSAPEPRLTAGAAARVIESGTGALNVRDQASTGGAVVGRIAEGAQFSVLGGPVCAGGIQWWEVEYDGLTGWAAEGADGEYFVEPAPASAGQLREIEVPASPQEPDGDCGPLPSRADTDSALEVAAGLALLVSEFADGQTRRIETNRWMVPYHGPICHDGAIWWRIDGVAANILPEVLNGEYLLQPFVFDPAPPAAVFDIAVEPPVISTPDIPLPTSAPDERVVAGTFSEWDWDGAFDPTLLVLPETYQGDVLPDLPVDLNTVHFVEDAGLTDAQLRLLARNGFVVVPAGLPSFDRAYQDGSWDHAEGRGDFITTDALLHSLFLVYENMLKFLEIEQFHAVTLQWTLASYNQAYAQYQSLKGTALEEPARLAAVYYGVALRLIDPYLSESPDPTLNAAPEVLTGIDAISALALAAEAPAQLQLFDQYEEDFTQYKPRGYYGSDEISSAYFRAMMWLGRITFRARNPVEVQAGVLAMTALRDGGGIEYWRTMDETLAWLVGPVDDLGPVELMPLVDSAFGGDLAALADEDALAAYTDAVMALPGPQINGLPLPVGITEDQLDEFTRGFRVFGQRFTLDGYIMQRLIYPAVGEFEHSRLLPMGEDIAAALGSDLAFVEADEAGATTYLNYTDNLAGLRAEVNGIAAEEWNQNLYGAWLHALQPLAVRARAVPPMMQTDAWKYKDMNTLLGSLAELKHATLLYAKEPYGGYGGGGFQPPVTSYTLVEPNPLVFARIAVIAEQLADGLQQRGLTERSFNGQYRVGLIASVSRALAALSADLAEIARKQVAGEPVTEDEYYMLQEHFAGRLSRIRVEIEELLAEPPERMAIVADVASNPTVSQIFYMATGDADLIYVVANGPFGLHLTRGAVYSTYLFTGDYAERLDDDQWRARVAAGELPPRPSWTETYRAE